MTTRPTSSRLLHNARELRQNATAAEKRLWQYLRNKRLGGFKFRRQHILEPFIVDFYCASRKLVVEVDGSSHGGRQEQDQKREDYLVQRFGVTIVRVLEADVLGNLEGVLNMILRECRAEDL